MPPQPADWVVFLVLNIDINTDFSSFALINEMFQQWKYKIVKVFYWNIPCQIFPSQNRLFHAENLLFRQKIKIQLVLFVFLTWTKKPNECLMKFPDIWQIKQKPVGRCFYY